MRRILVIGVVVALALVFTAVVFAGCGEETKDTVETAPMEDETTETSEAMEEDMVEGTPSASTSIPEAQPGAYTDLTPAQSKELIDTTPDLIIIDVSPHYDDGHLPGAVNYYLGDGSLESAIPTLDKEATYLVYCHVDSASVGGAEALVDAGFTRVYRLEGNYAAWVDAGYPVDR